MVASQSWSAQRPNPLTERRFGLDAVWNFSAPHRLLLRKTICPTGLRVLIPYVTFGQNMESSPFWIPHTHFSALNTARNTEKLRIKSGGKSTGCPVMAWRPGQGHGGFPPWPSTPPMAEIRNKRTGGRLMKRQPNTAAASFRTSLFEVSAQVLPSSSGLTRFSNTPANSSRQKENGSSADDENMTQLVLRS